MLNIDRSGNITVNRGDTFKAPLFIDVSDDIFHSIRFPFSDNDKLYFYVVEPNCPLRQALIKKEYTKKDLNSNGDVIINFKHEDTC